MEEHRLESLIAQNCIRVFVTHIRRDGHLLDKGFSLSILGCFTQRCPTSTMSLPLHLRTYQEPSKQDQSRLFFNVPTLESLLQGGTGEGKVPVLTKSSQLQQGLKEKELLMQKQGGAEMNGWQEMEISAVLSVEGKDEVYVCSRLVASLMRSHYCLYYGFLVWKTVPPPAIFVLHLSRQTLC